MLTEVATSVPDVPYRGIDAFRFQDHAIFFSRERETERLVRLVSVYRGVLLYGESGCGKSSLINAGLIPEALKLGFAPERLRVEPHPGGELVIRPIGAANGDEALLPSVLAPDAKEPRIVRSIAQLEPSLDEACKHGRPLLIFDQFEEIVTRFTGPESHKIQKQLVALIVRLLHGKLPVKVLLSFREDYLGKIRELMSSCPELIDQVLRVTPPSADSLYTMIRGPFDENPNHFSHELSPALGAKLASLLQERFGAGEVSLSEMQIVCLRLWQCEDPETLLEARGLQGLLEDHLGEALENMPARLRGIAVLLLSQMVTSAGTRNVISEDDLLQRVREQTGHRRLKARGRIADDSLQETLSRLSESRLVQSERHRNLEFYEITSEFLIPWIRNQRQKLRESRERKRRFAYGALATLSLVVALSVAALALWALNQRANAQHERADAQHAAKRADGLALASDSQASLSDRLDASLLFSLAALAPYNAGPASPAEARSSMIDALLTARLDGVVGVLHGHTGPVNSVAFNSDGSMLASGNNDHTVRLWKVDKHREAGAPLRGQGSPIESVAFSPVSATLAAGDQAGHVRIWDVAGHPHVTERFQGAHGAVNDLTFSPGGQTVAAAYQTGTVYLWSVKRSKSPAARFSGSGGAVHAVAFSPDGRMIALANEDGAVTLWSIRRHGHPVRLNVQHVTAANSVAFSNNGKMLAAAYRDGRVRVWNLRTHQLRYPLIVGAGPANSVAFSPKGSLVAAGGGSGVVRLWNVARRATLSSNLGAPSGPVYSVAFSPNGRTIASARGDGTVRLSRTAPMPLSTKFLPGPDSVIRGHRDGAWFLHGIAVSQDGTLVATTQHNSGVQLRNLQNGRRLWFLRLAPHPPISAVALGGGQGYVAAGDVHGDVTLASTAAHKPIRRFAAQPSPSGPSPITSLAISPDGRRLAAGTTRGDIRIWDIESGKRLKVFEAHHEVNDLAFNPRGTTLASANSDGTVRLSDIRGDKKPLVLSGNTGQVYGVAFSPDGSTIASANQDGTVRLWSVAKGHQLILLTGHTGPVFHVAYSPDGSMLVSAGSDKTVRLWDAHGQRQIGLTMVADDAVESAAFADGGQKIASSDSTGTLRLYRGFLWNNYRQLQKRVCGLVGTGLSPSEWKRFAPRIPYQGGACR